jgi:release factor glutamine methyltransferase
MDVPETYARGNVEFMGIELMIAPGALVPRKETELLGLAALDVLEQQRTPVPRVIDMCCGTGNLACAIASRIPAAEIWASDLTEECVALARDNARRLGLEARVSVHRGDLFGGLEGAGLAGRVDLVVCNPPYIPARRLASDWAHLVEHEPREAFDGGPFGMDIYLRVLKEAPRFLRQGGVLLFETTPRQQRPLQALFERARLYDEVRLFGERGNVAVVGGRRL